MRYYVQGVGESIRFEIQAGVREPEGERQSQLCEERICQAAQGIEEKPWAWALGMSSPGPRSQLG